MDDMFRTGAGYVATAAEACAVACIALGMVKAMWRVAVTFGQPWETLRAARREMFTRFASWIMLALEFALAADIVDTAIAPTWDDIGRLAAIAAIRTVLNWFLERDIEEAAHAPEVPREAA